MGDDLAAPIMGRRRLGDLLREAGLIDDLQLASALGQQRQWGGRLGQILVQMGIVDDESIVLAVSRQLGLPVVRLVGLPIPADTLALLPQELSEKHLLLPWARTRSERGAEAIHVAMSDPTNLAVIDAIAFHTGRRVEVAVASERDVELAIRHHFHGESWSDQKRRADTQTAHFGGADVDLHPGDGALLELDEPLLLTAEEPFLEQELGTEGVPDRLILLALARLLIRKGLVNHDEWIAEIARR